MTWWKKNGWLNSEFAAPRIAQPVGVRIVSQRAFAEINNRVIANEIVIGLDVAIPVSFNDWCPICDVWYAVQVLFGSTPFGGTQDPAAGALLEQGCRYRIGISDAAADRFAGRERLPGMFPYMWYPLVI